MFEKHREQAEEILTQGAEYQGALFMANFQTEDPGLKEQLDLLRWKVHQTTLAARYTDEMIDQWVGQIVPQLVTLVEMADTASLSANLRGMLLSMRDTLEEPGKYTFQSMDPLVTAGKAS